MCEVRFSCRTPGASTFLELDGELLALERGGVAVEPRVEGNRVLLDDLAAEEVVRVTARCATSRTGEGLHRAVDPADGEVYLYAMTFLDDAQRVFACFDQPDLKASYALTVDAPQGWRVLSNTRAPAVEGDRHVFAPTERIATYLMTLAAGPYEGETAWHDGVELGVWCRRSQRPHLEPEELLAVTRVVPGPAAGAVRPALPVRRQLRPGLRPGVQRRRDGEPRDGHLQRRVVRLPLAHHAGAAPGRGRR